MLVLTCEKAGAAATSICYWTPPCTYQWEDKPGSVTSPCCGLCRLVSSSCSSDPAREKETQSDIVTVAQLHSPTTKPKRMRNGPWLACVHSLPTLCMHTCPVTHMHTWHAQPGAPAGVERSRKSTEFMCANFHLSSSWSVSDLYGSV
jgi:hypothetical protein